MIQKTDRGKVSENTDHTCCKACHVLAVCMVLSIFKQRVFEIVC